MKTKKRIFAMVAVLIVCFMFVTNLTASAEYRIYEMDCRYDPDTHTVEFTGMLGAAYYEIRAYWGSIDIACDSGILMSTYTPDVASTGEEYYEVVLGDRGGEIDNSLEFLATQSYYVIKVYAYGTYQPVSRFSVKMEGYKCTPDKTVDKAARGVDYTARFYDDGEYKAEYGYLYVTMGGVVITYTDQVVTIPGDGYLDVIVTNVTGALYIKCSADTTPTPTELDAPVLSILGKETVTWEIVDGATEYCVSLYYVAPADYDRYMSGYLAPSLSGTYYVTSTSFDVAAHFTDLGYYIVFVQACYHTDEVVSPESISVDFDFRDPSSVVDYASTSVDIVIGESNPYVVVTGKSTACNKLHIVDKNGDGYDDDSFIAGAGSSGSGLTDLLPSILGAVAGFFVSVTGNMSLGGVTILSIFSIVAFVIIVVFIIKVSK